MPEFGAHFCCPKRGLDQKKAAYVCGPLTEIAPEEREAVKRFYERIADLCQEVTGARAFVPHEHYDPIKNANATPEEVDSAEREQVCQNTSCLIVVALAPSWGGGIEVEMANQSGVPVLILCEKEKLAQRRISRLLRGNPAVRATLPYATEDEALSLLGEELIMLDV